MSKALSGVVAIDGKTLRRSFDKASGAKPVHMISAWSSAQRLILEQQVVADKSNEITAIPELLDLLSLIAAIITIDAMGCQKNIASRIVEAGVSYVLALKGNQGTLRHVGEPMYSVAALQRPIPNSYHQMFGVHNFPQARRNHLRYGC